MGESISVEQVPLLAADEVFSFIEKHTFDPALDKKATEPGIAE